MDESMNSSTQGSLDQTQGETATEKVADVAGAAVDTAQNAATAVVDTAQNAAGAVADKVQDVTGAVTSRVDRVADAAADKVEGLADTVFQTALSGDAPEVQRRVAETTATVLDKSAQYLREGDLSLIMEDLRGVVRRHPLRALALGLGLGYLARGAIFGDTPTAASSRGARSAQPRMVPVYGSEFTTDTYRFDTGPTAPATPAIPTTTASATDIAPLTTDMPFTGTLGNDVSYGTDGENAGSVDTLSALATDTDTMSTSSFGATAGTTGDIATSGSDVDTIGDLALGGGIGATDASGMLNDLPRTGDFGTLGSDIGTGSDLGSSGDIGTIDLLADTPGTSGDFGTTTTDLDASAGSFGADLGGTSSGSLGAGGGSISSDLDDASTSTGASGDASTSGSGSGDDLLQSWDSQTRKRRR